MRSQKLAIVDDDEDILFSSKLLLNKYFEQVKTFSSPTKLSDEIPENDFGVVLLDLNYSHAENDGKEGLKALEKIKTLWPQTEVIVMTAYAELELAVEAIKKGAFDFVSKPWQNERLLVTVLNAAKKQEIESRLRDKALEALPKLGEINLLIGESEYMRQLREKVVELANEQTPILIEGENGSGKSLLAKHLHQQSNRSDKAFVEIDLASKEQLKKLFAQHTNEPSLWDLAVHGSIYLKQLEQIDEKTKELLLQKLNQATNQTPRLICSTNTSAEIKRFEAFNFQKIKLQPLRAHAEDAIDLLEYYVEYFATKHEKQAPQIIKQQSESAMTYAWPSNVKELKAAVERFILMEVESISLNDIVPAVEEKSNTNQELRLEEIEKEHVLKVLEMNQWNIQKSAADLAISRAALYRRIEKHNLSNEAL